MGLIIFNWLIEYIVKDIPVLIAVIGAGYWFSRQTKKALRKELQKELQKELKGVNARIDGLSARIDDHEKSVSDRLNHIQAELAEIKAEISFEKRVSKLEKIRGTTTAGDLRYHRPHCVKLLNRMELTNA